MHILYAHGKRENTKDLKYKRLHSSNGHKITTLLHQPLNQEELISVFESGAILLYLAQKVGKFIPSDIRQQTQTLEWLFWQVGGLGSMAGQNHHFGIYAPEKIPYAIERYVKEINRLYGVLNNQLKGKDYIVGEYSIADMACYPWIVPYANQQQDIKNFPYLARSMV